MKKKWFAALLVGVLSVGMLAGCGGGNTATDKKEAPAATEQKSAEDKVITIGATPAPHEEILKAMIPEFEKEGYTLDLKPFSDYVLPNKALASGELDANYFQHGPFLDNFNKENKTDLVPIANVHYEPMAIFPGKVTSFDNLKDGDKVAVPNDTTNEARALLLLQDNGLIKLKEGAGIEATKKDIVENPRNLEIVELDAAQIPRSIGDVAIAVINGNFAMASGMTLDNAMAVEEKDSLAAQTYANIVVVRAGEADSAKAKVLAKVLTSDACKAYITDHYQGTVLPV